jgi:hypothetical protein
MAKWRKIAYYGQIKKQTYHKPASASEKLEQLGQHNIQFWMQETPQMTNRSHFTSTMFVVFVNTYMKRMVCSVNTAIFFGKQIS